MLTVNDIFFLKFTCEEGKITLSRLVLRLPWGNLCYREVVLSRLEIVDKDISKKSKTSAK